MLSDVCSWAVQLQLEDEEHCGLHQKVLGQILGHRIIWWDYYWCPGYLTSDLCANMQLLPQMGWPWSRSRQNVHRRSKVTQCIIMRWLRMLAVNTHCAPHYFQLSSGCTACDWLSFLFSQSQAGYSKMSMFIICCCWQEENWPWQCNSCVGKMTCIKP